MRFEPSLRPGILIQRYKRFLADVGLDDGTTVTAHCPNSGSMLGCSQPGSRVLMSWSDSPTRKLPWTLELLEADGAWACVNTMRPNQVVAEAFAEGRIPGFHGYGNLRREVRYGKGSRVDILLQGTAGRCYVEVKSVNLVRDRVAYFPDAVTARGTKHLVELGEILEEEQESGSRAVLFYLVCRGDADVVRPADRIDEEYGRTLRRVASEGVEVMAWGCEVDPGGLSLARALEVDLQPPHAKWAW